MPNNSSINIGMSRRRVMRIEVTNSSFHHTLLENSAQPGSPIIVVGMHRSGTTLVTQMLSEFGVQMGEQQDRHREAVAFLKTNDYMLRKTGASWLNPKPFLIRLASPGFEDEMTQVASRKLRQYIHLFGPVESGRLWGWKDPRTTLTWQIWLKLFPEAKFILVVRNGIDVALSLKRRSWRQFLRPRKNDVERLSPFNSFVKGLHLWEIYCSHAMSHIESSDIFTNQVQQVRYEHLIRHPEPQLQSLLHFLGLDVAASKQENVIHDVIRSPAQRSRAEILWVRLLVKAGVIDLGYLESLDYSIE